MAEHADFESKFLLRVCEPRLPRRGPFSRAMGAHELAAQRTTIVLAADRGAIEGVAAWAVALWTQRFRIAGGATRGGQITCFETTPAFADRGSEGRANQDMEVADEGTKHPRMRAMDKTPPAHQPRPMRPASGGTRRTDVPGA